MPRLIVCKPDGSIISLKGRSEVESKLAVAAYIWLEAAKDKPVKSSSDLQVSSVNISKIAFNDFESFCGTLFSHSMACC